MNHFGAEIETLPENTLFTWDVDALFHYVACSSTKSRGADNVE